MKKLEKNIALGMLLFAIGFNLWMYRLEPTAKTDPNDNTFQYPLVLRTNQIWDFALKTCSSKFGHWDLRFVICHQGYLVDHWVPNWAQGYNLPYYYSHLPQILVVASYRLISFLANLPITNYQLPITLFQYYHFIIYLLLSLFPLTVFLSLRVIGLPWLTAGFGSLIASHISTDGLYGLDPPSFLWRGYGLSSQLFAMIFLPLAIAYAYNFFVTNGSLLPAVFFLTATTAGHLGIGIIAFLSIGIIALAEPLRSILHLNMATLSHGYIDMKRALLQCVNITMYQCRKLLFLFGGVLLLLGYWIIPAVLNGAFHNISFWDPVWKFNSFGAKEVLKNLLNGDLFDFGRLPILTLLTFVGFFSALWSAGRSTHFEMSAEGARSRGFAREMDRTAREMGRATTAQYFPFALLFGIMLALYFGRTTWGGLIDLIPGMQEFHLSRMIVGVHLVGLFLIPISVYSVATWFQTAIQQYSNRTIPGKWLYCCIVILLGIPTVILAYPQTIRYARHNDFLIRRANAEYEKVKPDLDELFATLRALLAENPGRIYVGRGGNWGNEFKVAETPMYIYLPSQGFSTILWMPQTWSPSSDIEQYFSEDNPSHYILMNIRYVVAPPAQKVKPFWSLIKETPTWKLYEVSLVTSDVKSSPTSEVTSGVRPAVVSSSKLNYKNVVRLWIQSPYHEQSLYPQLCVGSSMYQCDNVTISGLPHFSMIDEATYKTPDGKIHSLFAEPPRYLPSHQCDNADNVTIVSQQNDTDMIFRAQVEAKEACKDSIVILRQTYHPSWRATIDGELVKPFAVFPFYTAIIVEKAGLHDVVFSYQPSKRKVGLLLVSLGTIAGFVFWLTHQRALRRIKA